MPTRNEVVIRLAPAATHPHKRRAPRSGPVMPHFPRAIKERARRPPGKPGQTGAKRIAR